MRVSVNGPSLNNLSPYRGLELWWAAAQKRMHVHGNKGEELKRGAQNLCGYLKQWYSYCGPRTLLGREEFVLGRGKMMKNIQYFFNGFPSPILCCYCTIVMKYYLTIS